MIDFHTHILPEMDDGSFSAEESVAMLKTAAAQGITDVLLTSHYYADENSPAEFLARRAESWEKLKPYLTPDLPRVHLGAEVQYFEGICGVEDICGLRIGATEFLLLEMPFCRWTDRMIDDVLALNDHPGMQIVLAHIERYLDMQPSEVWEKLRFHGILMQSNVSFFARWRTYFRAMRMLSKHEIDFLGSDCHNMKYRRPNWDLLPKRAGNLLQNGEAYREFSQALAGEPMDRQ